MNKQTFMDQLARGIAALPVEDRQEILADYHEHFVQGQQAGESEETIAEHLGKPEDIAKDFVENNPNARQAQFTTQAQFTAQPLSQPTPQPTQQSTSQSIPQPSNSTYNTNSVPAKQWDIGMQILTGLGLAFLTFCVVLPLICALFGVLSAFAAVGVAIITIGFSLGVLLSASTLFVFSILFMVSFGLLWMIGTVQLFILLVKGCIWYVRMCISLVEHGRMPVSNVKGVAV